MRKPDSLSDAIQQLENVTASKTKDFKDVLEKDFESVKKALEDIKPYLDDLKQNVSHEVKEAKENAEDKIRKNPWAAVGIVGLIAFFIGLLIGNNRR